MLHIRRSMYDIIKKTKKKQRKQKEIGRLQLYGHIHPERARMHCLANKAPSSVLLYTSNLHPRASKVARQLFPSWAVWCSSCCLIDGQRIKWRQPATTMVLWTRDEPL
jgi:hypothetical protein